MSGGGVVGSHVKVLWHPWRVVLDSADARRHQLVQGLRAIMLKTVHLGSTGPSFVACIWGGGGKRSGPFVIHKRRRHDTNPPPPPHPCPVEKLP